LAVGALVIGFHKAHLSIPPTTVGTVVSTDNVLPGSFIMML
jgi:hypothetical protein